MSAPCPVLNHATHQIYYIKELQLSAELNQRDDMPATNQVTRQATRQTHPTPHKFFFADSHDLCRPDLGRLGVSAPLRPTLMKQTLTCFKSQNNKPETAAATPNMTQSSPTKSITDCTCRRKLFDVLSQKLRSEIERSPEILTSKNFEGQLQKRFLSVPHS